ncbi:MAG: transcriptional regulator [Devosia sp.]|nr:transcriptional regulator [Devosia sp.]
MVEDLITALSRFRTFAVIARNWSFSFKGKSLDVRRVAAELWVRYLLEGSVRPIGARIRITAQLIDGTTGKHLWAERFDRELVNVFDVQDEITDTIAGFIEPQIRRAELERVRRKRPDSLDAWDLYVQAVPLVLGADVSAYSQAISLLERAIGLDPNYAPALTLAAWAYEKRHSFGGPRASKATDPEQALELATRAVIADGNDALALAQLGWQRIILRADYAGLQLCDQAVAVNQNSVPTLHYAGNAHLFAGNLDRVTEYFMRALVLSPAPPDNYVSLNGIASGHFSAGRYEEAIHWAERTTEAAPDYMYGHIFLAASNALTGRQREARHAIDAVLRLRPDLTVVGQSGRPMRYPERRARMLDGLRKAGLTER